MAGEVDLPVVVDGTDPSSGTPFDKAFRDGCQTAIDDKIRSGTNPTISPAIITDEVVDARGNMGSLNARISVAVDANGNRISEVAPSFLRNLFVLGNLTGNGTFKQWSRGPAAAPDRWALTGGGSVAQCGVGMSDTTVIDGQDDFSAKLTYSGSATALRQKTITSAMAARMGAMLTRSQLIPRDGTNAAWPGYDSNDETLNFYLIGHIRTLTGGIARMRLYDSSQTCNSPYHDGNNNLYPFKALIAGPLSWSNSEVVAECRVEGAGSAFFQCISLIAAPLGLEPMYLPDVWVPDSRTFPTIATPTVGTGYGYFIPHKPAQLIALSAYAAGTVPTGGTTLKFDIKVPIGGTFVSVYQTVLAFTASDRHAYAAFDPLPANMRRLTVRPTLSANTAIADNSVARLDVTAQDSGATGAGIVATLHYLEQLLPLDAYRAPADLGEA